MFYRLCILLVLLSTPALGSRIKRQSNSIGVSGSVSINGSLGLGSGGSKESEEDDGNVSPSPSTTILPSILNSLYLLGEFSTARANQRVIEAMHLLAGILQNSTKTLSDDINESIQLALSQVSTGTSTSLSSLQGFLNSFSQYINGSLNNSTSTLKSTLQNSINRLNGFIQSSSGRGLDAFLKAVTVPAETYRAAMNRLSNQLKNGLTALIENRSQYPYSVFSSATSILAQLNMGALNSTLQNILMTNPSLLNDENNVVLPFTALIKYLEGMGSTSIQKSASLISSQIFTILNAFGNLVFSLFGFNPNANITIGAGAGTSGTNNLGGSVGGSGNLFSLFG